MTSVLSEKLTQNLQTKNPELLDQIVGYGIPEEDVENALKEGPEALLTLVEKTANSVKELTIVTEGAAEKEYETLVPVDMEIIERALSQSIENWFTPEEIKKWKESSTTYTEEFHNKFSSETEFQTACKDATKRLFVLPAFLNPEELSDQELIRLCLIFFLKLAPLAAVIEKYEEIQFSEFKDFSKTWGHLKRKKHRDDQLPDFMGVFSNRNIC